MNKETKGRDLLQVKWQYQNDGFLKGFITYDEKNRRKTCTLFRYQTRVNAREEHLFPQQDEEWICEVIGDSGTVRSYIVDPLYKASIREGTLPNGRCLNNVSTLRPVWFLGLRALDEDEYNVSFSEETESLVKKARQQFLLEIKRQVKICLKLIPVKSRIPMEIYQDIIIEILFAYSKRDLSVLTDVKWYKYILHLINVKYEKFILKRNSDMQGFSLESEEYIYRLQKGNPENKFIAKRKVLEELLNILLDEVASLSEFISGFSKLYLQAFENKLDDLVKKLLRNITEKQILEAKKRYADEIEKYCERIKTSLDISDPKRLESVCLRKCEELNYIFLQLVTEIKENNLHIEEIKSLFLEYEQTVSNNNFHLGIEILSNIQEKLNKLRELINDKNIVLFPQKDQTIRICKK